MLEILSIALTLTDEALNQVIDDLCSSFGAIVHVRASDVAFHIDAQTQSAMTQGEFNALINYAEALIHPKRVAYFAQAYNL